MNGLTSIVGGGPKAGKLVAAAVIVLVLVIVLYFALSAGGCKTGPPTVPTVKCDVDKTSGDQRYTAKSQKDSSGEVMQMGAVPADETGLMYNFDDHGGAGKVGDDNKYKKGPYGQGGGDAGSSGPQACRSRCTADVTNADNTQQGCVAFTWDPTITSSHSQNCFLWTQAPAGMVATAGGWESYINPLGLATYA